jgi:diguanylate cyclase (GGDEF)-like protein/PAS domain S-box-containing protein
MMHSPPDSQHGHSALTGNELLNHLRAVSPYLPGFIYQLCLTPDGKFQYTYTSPQLEALFGVTQQQVAEDAGVLLTMIHPGDYQRVINESIQCVETLSAWHSEFRMILKDGHIIWIEAYDTPIREADGTIVWTGYGNDITQRKSYETALNESESKFRAFVENANDIIYSLSLDGLLTYVSPNWTEILGHPLSDVIGRNFDQFVHPDDVSACHIFLQQVRHSRQKHSGIEYRIQHFNGHWCWHRSNTAPLFDNNGEVDSFTGIAREITEHKLLMQRMSHMAHHDTLTGLPNRASFTEHLNQAIVLSERENQALAVLFLDLDKFKPVNDRHGHAIGDLLLQQVANRIRQCLRGADIVGRIGGDEFVVLLQNIHHVANAQQTSEKICECLSLPYEVDGKILNIGVSIGIAVYPLHGSNAMQLVRYADEAMYEAKRLPDRIQVFASPPLGSGSTKTEELTQDDLSTKSAEDQG